MRIGAKFLDIYSSPKVISNGFISNISGEKIPYSIELGLNKTSILECNSWNDFTTNIIMSYVDEDSLFNDVKKKLQGNIMLEDSHWDWIWKASHYNSSEYNWFFLKTSDGVQGVCITFHPKKSKLQEVNIFYIEFISSAPWNRKSILHDQKYKGIGTEIIKQIQYYFINNLNYCHGFSLLSLPQAREFYEKIGMINIPEYNKCNRLFFYEMNKENAISLLENKNV